MTENSVPATPTDTSPLYRLIRKTRSLLRSSWVATGAGLTVGLLLGTLVAVTVLDLVVPLWEGFRLVALLVVLVPAVWAFFTGVLRPLVRRLTAGHVARRIEARIPGIHNRLVSCIDLDRTGRREQYSPAFYQRLLREALERIKGFRPRSVVDFLSLRRAGVFAFCSTAAFLLAYGLFSDRMPRAMARIFHPFEDLPPVTGVVFEVVTPEPDAKVLRGEDLTFSVRLDKGEPDWLRLEMRAGEGSKTVTHDLKPAPSGLWQVTLNTGNIGEGFEHSFRYRVVGGGTWTLARRVTVLERPSITEYHTVLHYPEYMGLPEPKVGPTQIADVTGPEESRVEVVVRADGDVKEGDIQFLNRAKKAIPPAEQTERVWFEEKLPAGSAAEGTWQWDNQQFRKATHTEPAAFGSHGHWFQGAQIGFQVDPGDNLFTYVYVVPGKAPDTIMLQWHDGSGWEHRAYWGLDKISMGRPDSPSRRRIGPVPPEGEWVRLEVPAELVDLQGKVLRGMSFNLHGGQCYWHRAGAVRVEEEGMVPYKTLPMERRDGNEWAGFFPLLGTGFYRVELRNELGHANKPMKEGKYLAIPDDPPEVVIEQPGNDIVLSQPGKMPLVVSAEDTFGLAEISLSYQKGDQGPWEKLVLKKFDKPQQKESVVSALDLAAMQVKLGEFLRYHAEAKDRKGQVARTQDYVVRVQVDPNAADRQLSEFDKSEDPFRQKLVNLIGQQEKVREKVEKLAAQYAPLDEKMKAAQEAARAKMEEEAKKIPAGQEKPPVPEDPPFKLDPESEKMLQELRKEIAQLAQQEQQNAQLAQQMTGDLKQITEQANRLQMLPKELAAEFQAVQDLFARAAMQPLQELANRMNKGGNPQGGDPKTQNLKTDANRVQKNLEAIRDRFKALDEATKNLRSNADEAMAKLRKDLLNQKGTLSARDLEELKNFIAALREELKKFEGKQVDLGAKTKDAADSKLDEVEKNQADLDKGEDDALDRTKELQKSDKMKRVKQRKRPNFPDSPYDPDVDDKAARPMEEDTEEPAAKSAKDKGKASSGEAKDKNAKKGEMNDDEDEDLFLPALGGARPKTDPRYADKVRPVQRKGGKPGEKSARDAKERRGDLQSHQDKQLDQLNRADQSLESDEKTVEQMLRELREAMQNPSGTEPSGQENSGKPNQPQDLSQMMKSQAFQQAMAMANRMKGLQSGQRNRQGQRTNFHPSQAPVGNLNGAPPPGAPLDGELDKLDLGTRQAILKLPPQLREELLQSMREEGPEGYREMIQDYFKRLTQVPNAKK